MTIAGSIINVVLLVLKFAAGILGHSAAMIADAIHSLTDFATDVVVLVFVKLGNKPMDKDHDYGHGKYETLATAIIGISLFVVGVMICYSGVTKTYRAICGETLQQPGIVALIAAIVSVVMKEWAYQFTVKAGKKYHSEAVVANAWHHRSDALSSIGTMFGIGGAIILGEKWAVLDPLAAIIVSAFIIKAAWGLVMQSVKELTDASLPETEEDEILKIANEEEGVGAQPKICKHLHLPVQCGSDRLLVQMNRHYTVEHYLELIEYARKKVPGITFSSDIIVGFPGETEEDFQKTLELVQKVGYMQLFTFIYSKRTGTKAADMPDPTPRKEKTDRMTRLLKVQDDIAMALVKAQVGQTVRVLVEGYGRNEGTLSGRLDNNLTVEFKADPALMGSYAMVRLTGARATVLLGELVE